MAAFFPDSEIENIAILLTSLQPMLLPNYSYFHPIPLPSPQAFSPWTTCALLFSTPLLKNSPWAHFQTFSPLFWQVLLRPDVSILNFDNMTLGYGIHSAHPLSTIRHPQEKLNTNRSEESRRNVGLRCKESPHFCSLPQPQKVPPRPPRSYQKQVLKRTVWLESGNL